MDLRFAKVKASLRFVDVILPGNNFQPDAGKRKKAGSTERYGLTGLSQNIESEIEL
jgi:hypothetical protein